jgi:cytochrome P450
MSATKVSFTDPAIQACPFAAYRAVREQGPVYLEPDTGYYAIHDYALIRQIAGNAEAFGNDTGIMRGVRREEVVKIYREGGVVPVEGLVVGDGDEHAFQRALVAKTFNLARVRKMEVYLTEVVDRCIDQFIDRGEADLCAELAVKVPISVIADQLGVPRADIPKFKFWTDAAIEAGDPSLASDRQLELARIAAQFHNYILEKADQYRANPADCLLSDLVHADLDGRKVTPGELVAMVALLIVAGNETTTNAMTNAICQIIETKGLEQSLRDNPNVIPNFIEEVLRYEAPLQALFRIAKKDVEVEGVTIPAGSIVVLRWGAGNRDPKVFRSPDVFDLNRSNARVHVTFGYGVHFCLGSHLARSELRIALERLLSRIRNLRWAAGNGSTVRRQTYVVYGLSAMQVAFDKAEMMAPAS